ncbi:MAG: DoxX family protein [Anaerolineae bacterium]|jgi:hypothetical protein|nr:DoxX family protein [Anaerolineae bacterium]
MNGLDGLLWVFSIVLAILLLVVGFVLVRDDPGGKKRMGWAEYAPRGLTLFFGIIMILGALGLIVPLLAPELAWLTPLAAGMLAAVMLGIAQSYMVKRDNEGAAVYILLLVMFIALVIIRWPALAARLG